MNFGDMIFFRYAENISVFLQKTQEFMRGVALKSVYKK